MPSEQTSTSPILENSSRDAKTPPPRENLFLNLGFNLFIPILLLNKGKAWFGAYLEPYFDNVAVPVLLIALAFPIGYFAYDYFKRSKYNIFSVLGLVSVLLTGGIGIFSIPTQWFAVKEAGIPFLLGVVVLVSLKTPFPVVRTLLFNPEVIDVGKVRKHLAAHGRENAFEQLLARCTLLLAASFFLSAALNYFLARRIVVSPSGSDAFNSEVSQMMAWSWPIIVIPCMLLMMLAMWKLFTGIKNMTGLEVEEILHGGKEKADHETT